GPERQQGARARRRDAGLGRADRRIGATGGRSGRAGRLRPAREDHRDRRRDRELRQAHGWRRQGLLVVKRIFWLALGIRAGAAAAVGVSATRWAKRQADKVAPANLAREAKGGLVDLSRLVSDSMAEGRRAMAEAEADARAGLDDGSPTSAHAQASKLPPD